MSLIPDDTSSQLLELDYLKDISVSLRIIAALLQSVINEDIDDVRQLEDCDDGN